MENGENYVTRSVTVYIIRIILLGDEMKDS
jgi:hypothetical protein